MNILFILLDSVTDRQGKIVGAIVVVIAVAVFSAFKKKDKQPPQDNK